MTLSADAIREIVSIQRPERIDIDGRPYVIKGYDPALESVAETIECHTLSGITDYVKTNIDKAEHSDLMIHVVSHDEVDLLGALTTLFRQREKPIESKAITHSFKFGGWYQLDEFIIAINSAFEPTEDLLYLQKLLGSVTQGSAKSISDNGVTQSLNVKSGVSFVDTTTVKNPLVLQPYRTFLEVAQPASKFLFRLNKNKSEEGLPLCSLIEADGGAWKLEAISKIKGYFKNNLPEIAVVA
ncbi:hypothetical protein [Desulforegula conservatrix]|uniref:hypothetical protein n=1 Tax=Desulforegula conservatrix TaxID=153026 RepID=UPI0004242C05|nr:hypothetical protein [Desulforegula conservatrix]